MSAQVQSPLTVIDAMIDGEAGGLRAVDGVIEAIGPEVEAVPGDEVIDAAGAALVPPMINAHTHSAMTLFRGYADDLPLMEWLEDHIWPAEAKLVPGDVYAGARLACAEMIRNGTSCFWDMYWQPDETIQAVLESGMRAAVGAPLIDGGPARADAAAQAKLISAAEDSLGQIDQARAAAGAEASRIRTAFAPHAIYTVSRESLEWIGATSKQRSIPIQIHLSETEDEVEACLAQTGLRPAAYLDEVGLLGELTLLAHGVWLDQAELELIAARGATIVANPAANMKLAVGGAFPYRAALEQGVPLGLGTDGPGSNNGLDLFADARLFALLQKHQYADAGAIDAAEVLAIARGARSPVLGGTARLEVGGMADFLLLDRRAPELALGSLEAGLAYAASGSVVDTNVVNGRVLMRGGHIDWLDEARDQAVAAIAELRRRLD